MGPPPPRLPASAAGEASQLSLSAGKMILEVQVLTAGPSTCFVV